MGALWFDKSLDLNKLPLKMCFSFDNCQSWFYLLTNCNKTRNPWKLMLSIMTRVQLVYVHMTKVFVCVYRSVSVRNECLLEIAIHPYASVNQQYQKSGQTKTKATLKKKTGRKTRESNESKDEMICLCDCVCVCMLSMKILFLSLSVAFSS